MSNWLFDSFNGSEQGAFKESRHGVRDAATGRNGYIFRGEDKVKGRKQETQFIDDLWRYTVDGDSWVERQKADWEGDITSQSQISSHPCPVVANSAYTMTGWFGRGERPATLIYVEDFWKRASSPWENSAWEGYYPYRSKIYVLKSLSRERPQPRMFQYDTKTNGWQALRIIGETGWHLFVTAGIGDTGYFYGGWKSTEIPAPVSWHRSYSANTGSTKERKSTPQIIKNQTGGALHRRAYMIGGVNLFGRLTRAVEAYNPKQDSWKQWKKNTNKPARLPSGRSHPCCFILPTRDFIHLTGGSVRAEDPSKVRATNFRFDAKKDVWSEKEPIPTPRFWHGSFAL